MAFSESLKKKIRERAHFRCCICHTVDVDIHHIVPQADGGENTEDNAAPLCPNCHGKYGANPKKRKIIREMRDHWYKRCAEPPMTTSKVEKSHNSTETNVIDFPGTNKGIVANTINKVEIKTHNKTIRINPPEGSIASSSAHKRYVKHLIDRYHAFKKSDVGHEGMKYPILYGSIKRKFGAKWELIPIERFDRLSEYLQQRIDGTILGKTRKSRGQKNYSAFSEYRDKYGG